MNVPAEPLAALKDERDAINALSLLDEPSRPQQPK
jgi:hypothetical protein